MATRSLQAHPLMNTDPSSPSTTNTSIIKIERNRLLEQLEECQDSWIQSASELRTALRALADARTTITRLEELSQTEVEAMTLHKLHFMLEGMLPECHIKGPLSLLVQEAFPGAVGQCTNDTRGFTPSTYSELLIGSAALLARTLASWPHIRQKQDIHLLSKLLVRSLSSAAPRHRGGRIPGGQTQAGHVSERDPAHMREASSAYHSMAELSALLNETMGATSASATGIGPGRRNRAPDILGTLDECGSDGDGPSSGSAIEERYES